MPTRKQKAVSDLDSAKLERITEVLETLIMWMVQAANSPISIAEANLLLKDLRR